MGVLVNSNASHAVEVTTSTTCRAGVPLYVNTLVLGNTVDDVRILGV